MNKLSNMIFYLILYSETEEYIPMYEIQSRYMKEKEIPHLFYCFKEQEEEYTVKDDILYIRGKETYIPGILDKTWKAIHYVETYRSDYTYIVRQNISTIIHYPVLEEAIVQQAPIDFGGPLYYIYAYKNKTSNLIDENYERYGHLPFISGICLIFSKKAIQFVLAHFQEIMDFGLIDDLALSYIFQILPSDIVLKKIIGKVVNNEPYNSETMVYRNRSNDRSEDVDKMKRIIEHL